MISYHLINYRRNHVCEHLHHQCHHVINNFGIIIKCLLIVFKTATMVLIIQPCIVIVTVEISSSIIIAITVIIKSCYHQSNLRRQQKKWAVITSYHWVNYRPMCGQTEQAETVVNSQSTSCNSRQLATVEFLQQKSSTEQTKSETVPALLGLSQIVPPSHCYFGFCSFAVRLCQPSQG